MSGINKPNLKYTYQMYFHIFSRARLMWDQNPKFTPLSETTSVPTSFIRGVLPPPTPAGLFYLLSNQDLLLIDH